MNHPRILSLTLSLTLCPAAMAILLVLAGHAPQAQGSTLFVAPEGDCGGVTPCYATIQGAVDAATDGDIIKVASGIYTDVHARPRLDLEATGVVTQVVYISKTVTIRGGYTVPGFADPPDPVGNPTTLDAQAQGRVLAIGGNITSAIEGLHITGGDAAGLGGGSPLGRDAGGGVYVYTATVSISNCVVYSNRASTTASGYGGGLYLAHSAATLNASTVISNTASTAGVGRGGGLCVAHGDVTLSGNAVQGNTASTSSDGDGGGLYFSDSGATLIGNTVRGNTASTASIGYGGGLILWDSSATLIGNTVQSNTASAVSYGSDDRLYLWAGDAAWCGEIVVVGDGGGLSLIGSTATLSNNTVISNTASHWIGGEGGGLSLSSSIATLIGNTVQGNTASTGTGSYSGGVGGGLGIYDSTATLIGNTVQGNTASTASIGYGGGLDISSSTVSLSGDLVQGNAASIADCGIGGGLFLWNDDVSLTNNLVVGNHANTEGSGLWFRGDSTDPTWSHLRHTTIADNNGGSGQGVYVGDYTNLAFTNTIIAGHASVGVFVDSGGTADLEATLWYNNGANTGGTGTVMTGTVNVYGDPAFIGPMWRKYRIAENSAAIDAGISTGVTTDIDGQPRPYSDGYDIGADEYWPPCVLDRCIYLPLAARDHHMVDEDDLLNQVLAAGKLVVATDANYAPWSFINDQGELDGFDVDVAKEVASRLGVDVEFVTPAWELVTAGNWGGQWDVSIGSMTPTDERAEVLWFADPYYYHSGVFVVHRDNTTITTVEELAGKRVGVGTWTSCELYLLGSLDIGGYGGVICYPPPTGVDVVCYTTERDALSDLALGDGVRLDAVMAYQVVLHWAIDEGIPVKYLGTSAFSEPIVFALDQARVPSDQMLAALNAIIVEMHSDYSLSGISIKWLGVDITEPCPAVPPIMPTCDRD